MDRMELRSSELLHCKYCDGFYIKEDELNEKELKEFIQIFSNMEGIETTSLINYS